MPELYSDDNGNRVIIRHKGPAGRGFPEGGTTGQILAKTSNNDFEATWVNAPDGTDAVLGPVSSVDGNFALYDGVTGKLIKDSGVGLTYFASASLVATKQDKETGKGLSQENFTTTLKTKLDLLDPSGFRGTFADLTAINAFSFDPVPQDGDYCLIAVAAATVKLVLWDQTNTTWTIVIPDAVDMTGQQIADVLFDATDSPDWDIDTCRIFTEAEKAQLAAHEALISSLGLGDVIRAYGSVSYFDLTGTAQTLALNSDGTNNYYKITVSSAVSSSILNFDNGGASDGRLRYVGTPSNVFLVVASLAMEGTVTGDFAVALAKNGAVISETRQLTADNAANDIENVTIHAIVTLLNNEYLEVFIGRVSGAGDPTVKSFSLTATKVA